MSNGADLLVDCRNATGESPVWHVAGQALSSHDGGVYALRLVTPTV